MSYTEGHSFGKGFKVKCLDYADDLMIAWIEQAGFCFNVTRCASLSTGYMSFSPCKYKRIVLPCLNGKIRMGVSAGGCGDFCAVIIITIYKN